MRLSKTLVVYTIPRTKEQKSSLDTVKRALRKHNINFKLVNRDSLKSRHLIGMDLVIAVGGDGTFLRAAHFIGSQIIFGVNSDTKDKEGFFMKSSRKDFEAKFRRIIKGKIKIKKLQRLEAYIDSRRTGALALNEFFIGARKSYHAAKYLIGIGNKRERQKSSGILITTPTGSYAWAKSCSSRTMPLDSKNFQFVVREPYQGKVFKNYKLKHGILKRGQKISITSEMLDGVIVADSVGKEHKFKNQSRATIKISTRHLNAIWA
jgi:NAD+ kinase